MARLYQEKRESSLTQISLPSIAAKMRKEEGGTEMNVSTSIEMMMSLSQLDKFLSYAFTGEEHNPAESHEIVKARGEIQHRPPKKPTEGVAKNLLPDVGVG